MKSLGLSGSALLAKPRAFLALGVSSEAAVRITAPGKNYS